MKQQQRDKYYEEHGTKSASQMKPVAIFLGILLVLLLLELALAKLTTGV